MNMLFQIRRWAAQRTKGSTANIALAKRRAERDLKKQGYSCKQAKAEVARRFSP